MFCFITLIAFSLFPKFHFIQLRDTVFFLRPSQHSTVQQMVSRFLTGGQLQSSCFFPALPTFNGQLRSVWLQAIYLFFITFHTFPDSIINSSLSWRAAFTFEGVPKCILTAVFCSGQARSAEKGLNYPSNDTGPFSNGRLPSKGDCFHVNSVRAQVDPIYRTECQHFRQAKRGSLPTRARHSPTQPSTEVA